MGEAIIHKCKNNLAFIIVPSDTKKGDAKLYVETRLQTLQIVWTDAPQRRLLQKVAFLIEQGIITNMNDLSHHSRGNLTWITTYRRFNVW